jgi:hypothetical protein
MAFGHRRPLVCSPPKKYRFVHTRTGMQGRQLRLTVAVAGILAEQLSSYAASSRSKKERYRRRPRLRSSVDTSSPLAHLDSS